MVRLKIKELQDFIARFSANASKSKLEQTKLNLLRINDILSEIEANIEPLKNQSEKAKKYLSLREELRSIEIGLFLYNIDTYKTKLEELMKDIDVINSQKTDEESRLSVLQNLKENLRNELEEVIAKMDIKEGRCLRSSNPSRK